MIYHLSVCGLLRGLHAGGEGCAVQQCIRQRACARPTERPAPPRAGCRRGQREGQRPGRPLARPRACATCNMQGASASARALARAPSTSPGDSLHRSSCNQAVHLHIRIDRYLSLHVLSPARLICRHVRFLFCSVDMTHIHKFIAFIPYVVQGTRAHALHSLAAIQLASFARQTEICQQRNRICVTSTSPAAVTIQNYPQATAPSPLQMASRLAKNANHFGTCMVPVRTMAPVTSNRTER